MNKNHQTFRVRGRERGGSETENEITSEWNGTVVYSPVRSIFVHSVCVCVLKVITEKRAKFAGTGCLSVVDLILRDSVCTHTHTLSHNERLFFSSCPCLVRPFVQIELYL